VPGLLDEIKRLADLPPIVLRAGVLTPEQLRKVLSKPDVSVQFVGD
jgi:hypothetical protein